jgi:uncharacterized protein (DUF486 family)
MPELDASNNDMFGTNDSPDLTVHFADHQPLKVGSDSSTAALGDSGEIDYKAAAFACVLLCLSCSFMICAWYLHLFYESWGMGKAILFSWMIALAEYSLQVPANRVGHAAGLSAASLRGIAEVFILTAFIAFQVRQLNSLPHQIH